MGVRGGRGRQGTSGNDILLSTTYGEIFETKTGFSHHSTGFKFVMCSHTDDCTHSISI